MKIQKVFLRTYGCSFNLADSQKINEILAKLNLHTTTEDKADLIIINTCAVKSNTEQKIISYLKKLNENNKDVIITGCLPFISKKTFVKVKSSIPNYVAIIHPMHIGYIEGIIEEYDTKKIRGTVINDSALLKVEKSQILIKNQDSPIGILQISEGCLGKCSFCATKNARGNFKAFPLENLKKQIDIYLISKKKEIWLTAQDCGIIDTDSKNFFELCKYLSERPEIFFVRIGMMNPEHIKNNLDKFLEIFQSNKFFKFLHIPIQSASNKILNLMNRKYTREDLELIFQSIKEKIPNLTIATDIIVGFPQEDKYDFQETLQFLEKIKPDVINISKFSMRSGTIAKKFKPLDSIEIKERSKKATNLVSEICFEKNKQWIGWEGPLILDEKGKNLSIMGRNPNYKCVVLNNGTIGEIRNVKIIAAEKNYCLGEVINNKQ